MAAASKLLANMVYNYKGMGLSMVRKLDLIYLFLQFNSLRPLSYDVDEISIKIESVIKISFLLQGTMICGWDKRVSDLTAFFSVFFFFCACTCNKYKVVFYWDRLVFLSFWFAEVSKQAGDCQSSVTGYSGNSN